MDQVFDFSSAAILVAAAAGLTQMIKKSFPEIPTRFLPLVALIVGYVATVATANSDWGDTQQVGGKQLSSLNFWSLSLVALGIATTSVFVYTGLKAVANIGQNKEGGL